MYFVLLGATLAATGKTVFMKKMGTSSSNTSNLISQNVISFFVAAFISLIILKFDFSKLINISAYSFKMSLLFAFLVIFTYLSQIKAMSLGNSSATMLIYSCGFLIPIVFGALQYGEKISLMQYIGVGLILPALFLIINPKGGGFSLKWVFFSFLSMTGSGLTAVFQKIHQKSEYADEFVSLITLEFTFAFLALLVLILLTLKKSKNSLPSSKIAFTSATNGVFIGVLNTLNLRLSGKLPAVVVFPIYNIGSLVLSGIILSVLYKEKLTKAKLLGLVLGIFGILFIGIG